MEVKLDLKEGWKERSIPDPGCRVTSVGYARSKYVVSQEQVLQSTKNLPFPFQCDRIYPCGACCSRGKPNDCVYPADANNKAIEQSKEIKAQRKEIHDLRKQVHDLQKKLSEIQSSGGDSGHGYRYPQPTDESITGLDASRSSTTKPGSPFYCRYPNDPGQRVNHNTTPTSSSSWNLLDKASFNGVDRQDTGESRISFAYSIPRGMDVHAYENAPADPFPSMWLSPTGTAGLLHVLPPREELFLYIQAFQKHWRSFYSYEMSCKELRHFLSDLRPNAEKNPQMLAFLFVSLARGVPLAMFRKQGPLVTGTMKKEWSKADIYMAAAMHALRLGSFSNRPTVLSVLTLVMMSLALVNAGRFLDSYTLFGLTIRAAQGLGLYQNPEEINPRPSEKQMRLRQNVWWRALYLDQYYSTVLGRPLGISTMGDKSLHASFLKEADPGPVSSINTYTTKYIEISRQIISCENLTNPEIDKFTDSLLRLQDTLPPEERFDHSWLSSDAELPLVNLNALNLHSSLHNYLILLNRRRQPPLSGIQSAPERGQKRGYIRVISSCHEVLSVFSVVHQRLQIGLTYWEIGQQAFNAAMILGLNIIETGDFTDLPVVVATRDIFHEMWVKDICRPAGLAVERLDKLLKAAESNESSMNEKVMENRGMFLVEDPEIRGELGDWMPIVFLPGDEGPPSNITEPRPNVTSPEARYPNPDRPKQAKEERGDGGKYPGGIRSARGRKGQGVNDPPFKTEYEEDPQVGLPFPSTIVGRDGDRRPYNTGIDDPRKRPRTGPYNYGLAVPPAAVSPETQNNLPHAYPDRRQYQPQDPSSAPGPLGYVFSDEY
ncbi:hypothetical protein FQN54_005515 [Arachnomyces sp. PD_36]|nr:hypothetical protein FQN54_005515 [Arachnomyces sp. PD_36]